jgi:hypothetical protein
MKNKMISFSLAVAAVLLMGAMAPMGARGATLEVALADLEPQSAASTAQEEAAYTNGTKAMDEQRWTDAVTAFDQVAAAKGKHADAALYWKAYSLDKLGRKDEARSTCDVLRQQMPSSTWNKECVVLRVSGSSAEARAMAEKARDDARAYERSARIYVKGNDDGTPHATSEDDIKLLAINSLMQQEPAKALPLLHDLILSDKPMNMRRQALFVLSRSKDPQAQAMLLDIAQNSKDTLLQAEAIQVLAVQRAKDIGPTLVQIYQKSGDAKVKRAAVNGLFIAHDAAHLVELARGEKDLNLKRDIVSQLAVMHDPVATAYMEELLK